MSPTVTFDNIVSFLNATADGITPTRTLTFYKDTISEASVTQHITSAGDYLHFFLGDGVWNTTDPVTAPAVQRLFLFYAAAMVLSVLCGGLIITGFDITMSDLTLRRSERGQVYMKLVETFMGEARMLANQLYRVAIVKEAEAAGEVPTYRGGVVSP
jgi:hypothetical protein